MNIKFGVIPLILITFIMAGCSSMSGFPERSDEVKNRLTSLEGLYFLPGANVLSDYKSLRPDKDKMKAYRDDVILGRMMVYDLQFSVFREAIYKEGIGTNLTVDILGVAVGAAGAAFTSATASRIMSALSGGIAGTGTAINENLFFKHTMPALLALMEAEREKIKAGIFKNLTLGIGDYPLGRGLVDLERYYFAGSIPGAIATVTKTAGQKSNEAENVFTAIRDKDFASATAQEQINNLLDSVDSLPEGGAWNILQNPPSTLDAFVNSAVTARLGGTTQLSGAAGLLGPDDDADKNTEHDTNAKAILKMILVLIEDRSPENLAKWEAAIKAQQ